MGCERGARNFGDTATDHFEGDQASSPQEEKMPAEGGTRTRPIVSASAMAPANSGPLPPMATRAYSRGSRPRSLDTALIARIMFDPAIRKAPQAASSALIPSGAAIFSAMTA